MCGECEGSVTNSHFSHQEFYLLSDCNTSVVDVTYFTLWFDPWVCCHVQSSLMQTLTYFVCLCKTVEQDILLSPTLSAYSEGFYHKHRSRNSNCQSDITSVTTFKSVRRTMKEFCNKHTLHSPNFDFHTWGTITNTQLYSHIHSPCLKFVDLSHSRTTYLSIPLVQQLLHLCHTSHSV